MSAWPAKPPQELEAWRRLAKRAERGVGDVLADVDERRFRQFSQRLGPLLVDYSKQHIDEEIRNALVELARQSGVPQAIDDLLAGAPINSTEGRAALHTALRDPAPQRRPEVRAVRERFLHFAEQVRNGEYRGIDGKPIATVVHIGIGGSHLGPELATQALAPARGTPEIRFLANIDGDAAQRVLAELNPATTLITVASKSFATLETRINAETAKSWFLERTCDRSAIAKHFVALTANAEAAKQFGIAAENCFPLWDWVGGRFSLWSAVGLPVAIALGRDGFLELLEGAHLMDKHFRLAPLAKNLPVLLALLQVWNVNFHGAATHAVLAYDRRLRRLPDYLQQLEMESNGKSVRRDGQRTATHTAPVIWGGEETNGQHAFHQFLHQGTRAFSADFIACATPGHPLPGHHEWLLANCLAQSKAMMLGRDASDAHRRIDGKRPCTTILLDDLTPRSLGALLALYEHKVLCAGVIWQVNPFDQFGVELGKELAAPIFARLSGDASTTGEDFSTAAVVEAIRRRAP